MALEVFAHASTVAAALFAALAPVSVVGLGLAPRVGPARAIALALTSRLRAAATVSQRAADVRALQTSLRCAEADQYIIVFGPKGVGKTCVVETATQRTCGVVSVRVAAGAPSDAIARQALSAIARVQLAAAFVDVLPSARRVIFWHRLLAGRPTVVLQLSERRPGADFADVTGAARELADLGLRVIMDASENSLEPGALASCRQVVLELGPMPRKTLEGIAELQPLREALQVAGLTDAAWAALGGNPAEYRRLREKWAERDCEVGALAPVLLDFVQRKVAEAVLLRDAAIVKDGRLEALYGRFTAAAEVPSSVLRELRLELPSPEKVLRALRAGGGDPLLIPANAAMALVLRHDLQRAPRTIDELKCLV